MNEYEYIIDSFTKEGDNTNLEVNNVEATCITSSNNNFELDSDGNLTVKSITVEEGILPTQAMLNFIYPVGSIYMSVNNTNPTTLFGGTWERIEDRFLYGASTDYPLGSTGGEKEVTLTVAQMPSHTHGTGLRAQIWYSSGNNNDWNQPPYIGHVSGETTSGSTGGSQPHNNMPPYLAVYMWKRTQ